MGINANAFNILYSYVDSTYFAQALAIKNCICGLCGFGSALVAGRLLSYIQANGNSLFGIPMFGQQALSAVSFVLVIVVFLFIRFVVMRQKQIESKY